jgi:hypothetical protein
MVERDNDFNCWENAIRDICKPGTSFLVAILPGAKGKGKFYSEIKELLIKEIPVPC